MVCSGVATRMGITLRLLNTLRKDLHVTPFPSGQGGRLVQHHSPLQAKVAELSTQRLPARVFASRLGVSRQTFYLWLKTVKAVPRSTSSDV